MFFFHLFVFYLSFILPKNDVWSLPPVVYSKVHVLFILFVFVYGGVQHILCCSCFFLFYFSSFCVSYVASFYRLSIYNYLFSILSHLFICTRIQCLSPQKYGVRNRPKRGVLDTIVCNHFVECSVRHK